MKKFKRQKGITLIALVVTVVILIILATISINAVFGENGLIKMAEKAKVLNAIKEKEEEVQFAITELMLENNMDASKVTVSAVVDKVKQNYKDQKSKNSISGASNEEGSDNFPGYIQYDPPSSTIDQTIIVNVDENLNVSGYAGEPSGVVKPPKSEYTKTGNIYYNTPDLSGFNPENTYYIVYDKTTGNNETIYGRMDKVKAPGTAEEEEEIPEEFIDKEIAWHDYESQIWANVATVNNDDVAYWTWIPRYKYKIDGTGKIVDIKFVDKNNECIEVVDGQEKVVDVQDYELPESFKFGEQDLQGYWVSKYEVQNLEKELVEIITDKDENQVLTTTSLSGNPYTIYLNGVKYKSNVQLPCKLSDLGIKSSYEIMVIREKDNKIIGSTKGTLNYKIEVDLSGFNPENTYYIVYDKDGKNEKTYGRMDKVKAPGTEEMPEEFKDMIWYDYEKKIWANVVTVNNDDVAYWTYIPRYEYKIIPENQYVDIRYIPVSQTEPDEGYTIPESFKFGGQNLKGYWVSKYEVQNLEKELVEIITDKDGNQILTTTNPNGNTYTIYLSGEKYRPNVQLPCKLSDLGITSDYEIMIIREKDNKMIGSIKGTLNYKIEVDLSGFNPENTYYVTYNDEGNEETVTDTKIAVNNEGEATNAPNNWYNYEKKIWANIVTKGKDTDGETELIAYWTYIPRYEYKIIPGNKYVDIRYIPVSQTEPDEGYIIPESFRFGGQDLKGYWVSKYEVQNK